MGEFNRVYNYNLTQVLYKSSEMDGPKKSEKKTEESPEASPEKTKEESKDSPEKPRKITGVMKPMKVSVDLAAIIGKKEVSRFKCVKLLWAYMKKNNLLDPEKKQYFTPDKKIKRFLEQSDFGD